MLYKDNLIFEVKLTEETFRLAEWHIYGTNIVSTTNDVRRIRGVVTRSTKLPQMGQLSKLFAIWFRGVRITLYKFRIA